jgi:carbon storage regulator CsrA
MLVLSRRLNERILFPTVNASVQVVALKPGLVRLGIQAPHELTVLREEVWERHAEWATEEPNSPAQRAPDVISRLVCQRLEVAAKGFDVLRRQLRDHRIVDAEDTLAGLVDDLELLRQRLRQETGRTPQHKRCKALLVEDDQNERELLASFLRHSGVDVDTAGDGTDALDYLRTRDRPDVLLLDMGLPRCDGARAVAQIRQNPALDGLKIFAVTGYLPEEIGVACGPGGVDRWFHKPLDPVLLLRDLNQTGVNLESRV